MPSISVIVPFRNVERYIERCARSLFAQTFEDIELIFVNDYSEDLSLSILEDLICKYDHIQGRVKLINLPNQVGQAAAFKKGLDISTGDYVIKCDGDDEIVPEMYGEMYSFAKNNNHDVVICDIKFVYPDSKTVRYPGRLSGGDDIEAILNNIVPTSLCNRLVKRDLFYIPGFKYPSDNMCEDFVYSIQLAYYAKSIGYIPKEYYLYYRHPASFTWDGRLEAVLSKHDQTVRNISIGLAFLKEKGLSEKYRGDILRQCLFVKNGLKIHINEQGIYTKWKNTFKEANAKIVFCSKIPFKERMVFLMIYCHFYDSYQFIKKRVK